MSRGHDRERAVKRRMEAEDWFVVRAAGSLGDADLVALRATPGGLEARVIEVKSTAGGPYERFGPADRAALRLAAAIAGAEAWLVWWPPHAMPRWIPSSEWPPFPTLAAEEVAA